jgi:hypothetical protein
MTTVIDGAHCYLVLIGLFSAFDALRPRIVIILVDRPTNQTDDMIVLAVPGMLTFAVSILPSKRVAL